MSTVDVVDAAGSTTGTVELPAEIFDTQVNIPLIHQVVVAQLAAARQGTHATLGRGEVSGGGRKPYRQKGTGRARQGSIRAPQFTGGGVVHGPTPHGHEQRTPKKMKAAALRGALSDRARDGRVHVVESFVPGDRPSTKAAKAVLASISTRPRALVVVDRSDELTMLSLRNLQTIHALYVDQLNTYDVLASDDVIFTRAAFDALVSRPVKGRLSAAAVGSSPEAPHAVGATSAASLQTSEATAAETPDVETTDAETPAVETPDVETTEVETSEIETSDGEAPYGAGSAAPLESGDAPEGYAIKGNTTSMKYHQPDGQWYEQTVAEVWFDSVDAAERAGFVEAGSQASIEANETPPEAANEAPSEVANEALSDEGEA